MQDIEIFVNNKRIELIGSEVIGLTLVGNDVAKLEKVNVNLSNGFSIPRTAVNELIFELSSEINSTSLLPYQKIPCYIKQNGIEIEGYTNATMVINEVKEKTYEVTLYGNEFDLLTALGDLKIWELPLTEYSHVKNTANIVIGVNAALSNGWCYPVIDWGYDENICMSNGNKNVATQNMYPALYAKPLLDKIFAQVGKSYTLPTAINSYIEKAIITIKPKKNTIAEIPVTDIKGHRSIAALNVTKSGGNGEEFFATTYTDIDNIALYEDINKRVRLKYKMIGSITLNDYPPTGRVEYILEAWTGYWSVLGDPNPPDRNIIHDIVAAGAWENSDYPKTQTFEIDFEKIAGLVPGGERFTNWFAPYYPFAVLGFTGGERAFEVTELPYYIRLVTSSGTEPYSVDLHIDSFIIEYEYYDFDLSLSGLNEGNTIYFSQYLPDLTCKDYIKSIMQIYGMTIKYDTFNDNFVFTEMNKIYDNLANGIYYDWSDKLISQIPTKQQFDLGYAQNNYVKWKDDKTDEIYDMSGFNLNLQLVNNNIELEKDLIKIPFAASRRVNKLDSDHVPKVRMVKSEGYEQVESRYLNNNSIRYGSPALIVGGISINEMILWNTPFRSNRAMDGYSFFDTTNNYGEKSGILNNSPRKLTALFNLDVLDIYNFDFNKAIYIKSLQSFFYVNRINNFINGKPTEVELIKL